MSAALMWTLYVYAAHEEEQKFLSSPLATSYAEYCRHTVPFWPRVGHWLVGG